MLYEKRDCPPRVKAPTYSCATCVECFRSGGVLQVIAKDQCENTEPPNVVCGGLIYQGRTMSTKWVV